MRQTEFEEHAFFEFIRTNPPPQWLMTILPRMGFWAHTFQDMVKLVEFRVEDPMLKSIASHIRSGDMGHDNWFALDMKRLGIEMPSLRTVYSRTHEKIRMASYEIVSEVYHATDDRLLIVLLLALESASYVFFESMTEYLEQNELPFELKYFGRNHLDSELEHGIVEAEMDMRVEAAVKQCSLAVQAEAHMLIDRVFAAFTMMLHGMLPEADAPRRRAMTAADATNR